MRRKRNILDPLVSSANSRGRLFVVGTPIGSLEDVTLRALRILKEVDLIACEDTRQTQKLLNHYSIRSRTVSYHQHNEMTRAPELVIQMEQGVDIALVTDSGMPVISDPGYRWSTWRSGTTFPSSRCRALRLRGGALRFRPAG